MAAPTPQALRADLDEETRSLLIDRVRLSLFALLVFLILYAVADYVFHPEFFGKLLALKIVQVAGVLATILLLRSAWGRRWAVSIVVAEIGHVYLNIAAGSVLLQDTIITPTSLIGISLVICAAYPWGFVPQLATTLFGFVALIGNALLVVGPLGVIAYPSLAGFIGLTMSLYLARVFERHRVALAHGEISRALAHIGRTMVSSLDAPILLRRLCEVTQEVLGCDMALTLLVSDSGEKLTPIAQSGYDAERWESIRVLDSPCSSVQGILARLEHDDVTELSSEEAKTTGFSARYGFARALAMALRRGDVVRGVHFAGHRDPGQGFSLQQVRIARGIAQIASMALENARLFDELERANSLKSDFLTTMSHELRTPLNVIIGYNDLLLQGTFGPLAEEQASTIRRTSDYARGLLDLINATLDISRLDSGRLPVHVVRTDPRELLAEIEVETRESYPHAVVPITWKLEAGLPVIDTDWVKLKVILKNLIANAIRFTSSGEIVVSAAAANDGVEFAVRDTGIGIAPEAQVVIFEPFRKADSAITVSYDGAGLGLYIARRLVELLGGTIGVESQPGEGSTFRVWIPTTSEARLPLDSPSRGNQVTRH